MRYAKIIDGAVVQYPITGTDIVLQNPNTSFPYGPLSEETMAEYDCLPVIEIAPPVYDQQTQVISEGPCVYNSANNQWETSYVIRDKTAEELQAQDDALRAGNEARAKEELLKTDWSELPTVRNTNLAPHLVNAAAFDAYRVALRAIVVNPPIEVTEWPARPGAVWSS